MMGQGRRHVEEGEGVALGMVITPMLDMSFQLMAFFIMTYHPSALEAHIDGKLLPPAKVASVGPASPKKDEKDPPPAQDEDPEKAKMTIRVIVKAVAKGKTEGKKGEGEPSQIQLKRPEKTEAETISDTDTPLDVGLKRLKEELMKIRKGADGDRTNVTIDADPDLKYGYFIQVQDTCKAARFPAIGFAAPLGP